MSSARRPRVAWLPGGAVLVAIWLLLWGDLSMANVLSGMIVAVAVLALVNRQIGEDDERIRVFATLHLIAWFCWQLVKASLVVAWEVLTPTQHVRQGIVAIDVDTDSPRVVALVANITSLIPGTLTLEVADDEPRIYVHVLHLNDIDRVRADAARLEQLVTRAVAPSSRRGSTPSPGPSHGKEPNHR